MSLDRRDGWFLGALTLLAGIYWYPLLLGYLPDFMDTVAYIYPRQMEVSRQLYDGTLPLWMTSHFAGAPLAANPQVAVWYPFNWLLFAIPHPVTYGLIAIVHYIIAGAGVYTLLRMHCQRRLAALLGAVLLAFGSMLISRIALMPHLVSVAWIPWMLCAVTMILREDRFLTRGMLLLAVFAALQFLAGAPQITYYTTIALLIYTGLNLILSVEKSRWGLVAFKSVAAAVIAFLLCGIQLLPTLEFLQHVERRELPMERLRNDAFNGSMHWRALVGYTGDQLEDTDSINAIGIGALLLVLLALALRGRRRVIVPAVAVMIVAFVLASGTLTSILYSYLPGYSSFNAPRRSLILFSVFGPIVAAFGFHKLIECFSGRPLQQRRLLEVSAFAVICAGSFWILPRLEREFTTTARFIPSAERLDILSNSRFLAVDPNFSYSYDSRRPDYGESLMPNVAAWVGLEDLQGYDPLVPTRVGLARLYANRLSGNFYPSHGVFISDPNSSTLRLYAVQHLVGRVDLYEPGRLIPGTEIDSAKFAAATTVVLDDDWWPVHRFNEVRPRAWFPRQLVPTESMEQALELALYNNVYLAAFSEDAQTGGIYPESPVPTFERLSARSVRVSFPPAQTERTLCVAEAWMPGWKVRAAGTPIPARVLPVNGTIIGVIVPPGATEVTLRYAPTSFLQGALLSLAGLVLLGVGFVRLRNSHPVSEKT